MINQHPLGSAEALGRGDDGIQILLRFVARLWCYRRSLIVGGIMGIVVGGIWAWTRPNQYTVTVTAFPPQTESRLGALSALALSAMPGLSLDAPHGSTQQIIAILESRHLHSALIEQCDLQDRYSSASRDQRLESFAQDFYAQHDSLSGCITWGYLHTDPAKAAAVATKAGEILEVRLQELTRSSVSSERVFLEEQLKQADQRLQYAYDRRAKFLTEYNVVDIDTQVRTAVEALADLQARRIAAVIEMRAQRAVNAGENNAEVAYLSAMITQIDSEIASYFGTRPHHIENSLLPISFKDLPAITILYIDLLREIKTQETVSAHLAAQVESLRIQQARSVAGVTIVDPAIIPDRPSGPHRATITLFLAVVGMICGFLGSQMALLFRILFSRWKSSEPTT